MINPRTLAAFGHDIAAVAAAWLLAYWLRFNFEIPPDFLAAAVGALGWMLPLFSVLFYAFRLYRGLWRFASMADLQHMVSAVGVGALLVASAVTLAGVGLIPRSVLVLHPILLALFMGGSRFLFRSWKEHRLYGPAKLRGQPVLVLGAGEAADSLLRELVRSGAWYAVALVDDSGKKIGSRLRGLPVMGPLSDVGKIAEKLEVRHVILAMPEVSPAVRRHTAEMASEAGLSVLTIPSYSDLLAGRVSVSQIRRVELDDLLGREAVELDDSGLHELLTDKVILVSGAGGSIGSEICRQVAKFAPRQLVFVEASEFALYRINEEIGRDYPELDLSCWAADVRDRPRVAEVMAAVRPNVVFHAAAYKHVPLMEAENAWQALRTNALGTLTMATEAAAAGVDEFVLISTDKAVNPTNVMGASKRLAERLCGALQGKGSMRIVTVRFGNVLGSNGSVIPKFREQIARGGPVTVTHPDIVRYFMTIPEASQLVLQAAWMGRGGEIFVLDMGEPVRIADLAKDMIRLSGFGDNEIAIEFTGLRPGEKLYEELLADDERTLPTGHPKLRAARFCDALSEEEFGQVVEWLHVPVREPTAVKDRLRVFVPEYQVDRSAQERQD